MMIRYSTFKYITALATVAGLVSCQPVLPAATPATPEVIQQQIESSTAPLTMVHVWATWCDPCREEFPELIKVLNKFQTLDVILISADDPKETAEVEAFLTEHQSPVGSLISTELSQKFIETLSPKWAGSLPSTFFYRNGKLVKEWEGKRTFEHYAETIEPLLNKQGD